MTTLGPRDTCPDCGEIRGYFHDRPGQCVPPKPVLTVVPSTPSTAPRIDGLHPYAAAVVAAELDRLDRLPRPWSPNSYWDQTTFDVACNLIELAHSPWSGYGLADAERDLYAHAPQDSAWGRRDHERKWQSAVERVGGIGRAEPRPGEKYVVPDVTTLTEPEEDGRDLGDLIRERLPLLDFAHLLGTEDEGEEWIVNPILPARRMVALYSAPKVGKSLLMLEIAVGVALGTPVLGVTPEPRRVLYVDFENDPRGDVRRRLEAMGFEGEEDGRRLNERLCYLSFPSIAKLDTPQGGFELLKAAQVYECDVVVIDTVSRAVAGEENDNDTWLAFYRDTGMLLKAAGIACIRLDHSGKDAEKGMRGGSAKYGDVDAVWRLTASSSTVLELVCTDHRMPIEEDRLTLVRETSPRLTHRVASDRTVALDAKEQELDRALDRLGVATSASHREAQKALKEAGYSFKKSVAERVVRARQMRLPEVSPAPRGDTGGHPSPVPTPPSVPKGGLGGDVPPSPGGHGELDDEQLIGCRSCYRPTTPPVGDANGGLCATCHRDSGQTEGSP